MSQAASSIGMTANGEHESKSLPQVEAQRKPERRLSASICPKEPSKDQRQILTLVDQLAPDLNGYPVLLIQNGRCPHGRMCDRVLHDLRNDLRVNTNRGDRCTVILHSYGGYGGAAYRLARFLQRHCGAYNVIIPSMAKSAGTLFALGAETIVLGADAELGPLDAQIEDLEREENISALEVVQCVERLNQEAMTAVDSQMILWKRRSGKKIESLMPVVTKFVADMMRPMFEKIDVVHFTGMARILKVAEDYALRLLLTNYSSADASDIAFRLTSAYSDHDFAIDMDECESMGLEVESPGEKIREKIAALARLLDSGKGGTMIGRLIEECDDAKDGNSEDSPTSAHSCRTSGSRCRLGPA